MPSPAFIVEGQMEQRILRRACPGKPVNRIQCNGDDVALTRMCDFIETQVRLLGNRHYPIIIIFDREKRELSAVEIAEVVKNELNARGHGDLDIRVFVADRETEDWYLKDVASICQAYSLPRPRRLATGKGGLHRLLSPVVDYHETTVGVDIFFKVSKEKIAAACPVFNALRATALELDCATFK